jgi:hypothetical protein
MGIIPFSLIDQHRILSDSAIKPFAIVIQPSEVGRPGQQNHSNVSSACDKLTSEGSKYGGSVPSVPLILDGSVSPVGVEMGQFRQKPLHAEPTSG